MQFGNVLRLLRQRNSMTQKQLAEILGVSESRIGMYERCQREPDFEMLEAIADYFNVDMDFLTGRTDVERQYTFSPAVAPALELSHDEKQLVTDYRALNEEGKTAVRAAVSGFVSMEIYKKRDDSSVTLGA